jgi:hypothetical protein
MARLRLRIASFAWGVSAGDDRPDASRVNALNSGIKTHRPALMNEGQFAPGPWRGAILLNDVTPRHNDVHITVTSEVTLSLATGAR